MTSKQLKLRFRPGKGQLYSKQLRHSCPRSMLGCKSPGIKATFVRATQDMTAVLTKGLGSHRTDDFRAFLENKELPPAITSVSARHGKEASVAMLLSAPHRERLGPQE